MRISERKVTKNKEIDSQKIFNLFYWKAAHFRKKQ